MQIRATLLAIACVLIACGEPTAQPQSSPRVQAEALFVEAQKALARGDSQAAESFLKEALSEEPTFTSAIWQLAQIYESRGKLDYARELLLRGLKQDPEATWAKEKLAQMESTLARKILAEAQAYMNAGNYDLAIPKISMYLGLRPNDQTALICMGKCHLAKGNLKTAREYFEKVRTINPDNEEIAALEADIHKRTQDATLKRLVENAQAAIADSASGDNEKARLALEEVIKEDLGNSWAKKQLKELNLRVARQIAQKEKSARQETEEVVKEEGKAVVKDGAKAVAESKSALGAAGTFVLKHITLFVLVAALSALIIDIRRKMTRRSYPLEGTISLIPILDIVSLINGNLRTGRLIIVNADTKGEIYFEKGEIIHARCEKLNGKIAFHKLMDLGSGRFFFHNHLPNVRHTITEPLSLLLLSMKPREESESGLAKTPTRDKILTT